MKSQIVGLRVASAIFGLVCAAHVLRVVMRVDVMVAGHEVPVWANVVGAVISGALSFWMCRLSAARPGGSLPSTGP